MPGQSLTHERRCNGGEWRKSFTTELDDGEFDIGVRVRALPHDDFIHRLTIMVDFWVQEDIDEGFVEMGHLTGTIVDKTIEDPETEAVSWLRELHAPPGYTHDRRVHPSENDELDEVTKALMQLYTQKGAPKAAVRQYDVALQHDQIHVISSFQLKTQFRGRGFAQVVMKAYLEMIGDCTAFEGPVVVSPAGFHQITRQKEKERGRTWTFQETVTKLVTSYEKSGFEVWLHGSHKIDLSMTILGQFIDINGTRLICHASGLVNPERYYAVRQIKEETDTQYLIEWEDDAVTGERYRDSWEPKGNAGRGAVREWEQEKGRRRRQSFVDTMMDSD